MIQLKNHINWLLGAGLLSLILFAVFIYRSLINPSETLNTPKKMPIAKEETVNLESEKIEEPPISPGPIMVDVQGSVKSPGVYEMFEGDRVLDVIKKAGGFLEGAEPRSVNQAQKISDEMIIYVAAKGEEIKPITSNKEDENEDMININTADISELQKLSGVGPSKAQSIVSYRDENGPFISIDELLEVRGIGEKTIEEWKDQIKFQ